MKKKELFKIEYLVYIFVLLIPIFDFLSSQYTTNSSIDIFFKISLIKIIIPLILYIYVLFKTKGKERLQFFIITFVISLYSAIISYIHYSRYINNNILKEDFLRVFNNIFNLNVFFVNFMIMYKIFFRKNIIKLRMSFNYTSAIYLISILLLSLISQTEPIWKVNLSLIILMLLFIALVSLRYKEDRTYSLILFIAIFGYYITTIRTNIGYYAIFIVGIIYFISIILEKYIKNQLSLADIFKILKTNIIKIINHIRDLNKSTVKRLKSGDYVYSYKTISGYSSKRIYRLNDLNRRKVYKSKESIQKYIFNLYIKRQRFEKSKLSISKGEGLKEVRKRLREKKKQKRQENIDKILNSKPVRIFTAILFILISLCSFYLIYKYISLNFVFEFDFKENAKLIIFLIPLIFVIFKTIYFSIFKFKNIDSEYIMLTLLVFYIIFLIGISKEIILDFSSGIILSTILIILINKTHLGKTKRDIEILKEQIEVKKGLKFKRRVVFGISSLSIGGVSRILVDICNGLSKKYPNLDVEIFTLFAGGEFEEDTEVKIISLFKKPFNSYSKTIRFFISMYLKLFEPNIFNKFIRGNYDTIIAFDEGDITNMFSYHDDAKKIAWVHNKNYNIYSKENKKYLKETERVYSRYDKIIFVREIGLRRFNKIFTSKKIRRIPKDIITNYVDPLRIFVKSEEEKIFDWTKKDLVLLSVVRLYKHKAVDRFIKVHKRILKDGLFHKVYIIGDGPEMENLKKLIREEKLQTTVFLLGTKINPYPYIKACDYFCLFSEREEYSIVLNEAKILNKNILITDTLTRDVVLDYPNVRVFDNSESGIYTGLRYVLSRRREDKTNFEYIYQNEDILKQIYSILE